MRSILPLLLVVCLLPLAPARAEEGVVETWDRILVAGAHAGFVRTRTRTVDGEPKRVETEIHSEIALNRMGRTLEVATAVRASEGAEGRILRLESWMKMSAQESSTVYTFEGSTATAETQVMGTTRTAELEVPEGIRGPHHGQSLLRTLAGTPDGSAEYLTFLPEIQSAVVAKLASKGPESVELPGGTTTELTRVESTLTLPDGTAVPIVSVSWLGADGAPIKTRTEAGGLAFESFRVKDEAEAKRADDATAPEDPDVFLATVIREADPIPVPRRLEEAVIVLRKRKADARLPDVADASHHVTPEEDGSLLVRAVRSTPPEGKTGTRPLAEVPPELKDALAPSSMVQSDAPEIVAIAKEVVGAETSAWKAAQALERWVWKNITEKSLGVGFASALEVCRDREGDCSEHSVLLAALCRAAGIPARVVMGLEYLLGIWGGHAWNEVWVDGAWYPLDATNGLGFVDPMHLPMARMTLAEGAQGEFLQLLAGLGSIDVDVVEVVRDGRRIRVGDPALVTTTDGTWSNRVLGIAFRAPTGYAFDPPERAAGMSAAVMELDGKTAEGEEVEIEVHVMDAPRDASLAGVAEEMGVDLAGGTDLEVDGRPARALREEKDGRARARVVVVADGALWMFELDRAGAAEESAFGAFLASVDFDVR